METDKNRMVSNACVNINIEFSVKVLILGLSIWSEETEDKRGSLLVVLSLFEVNTRNLDLEEALDKETSGFGNNDGVFGSHVCVELGVIIHEGTEDEGDSHVHETINRLEGATEGLKVVVERAFLVKVHELGR